MRLFLAVEAPMPGRYAQVTQEIQAAMPGARPVPEGQWHATLRFLGEVEDPDRVAKVARPIVAQLESVPIIVQGLGAFPNAAKARVLWAGMEAQGLETMAHALEEALPVPRDPIPPRPFRPHVTLGRLDPPRDARGFLAAHAQLELAQGRWEEVVLFRSDLRPGGPVYTKLATFPLAGRGSF